MGWSQVYKILILWGFTEKSNFYGGEKKKGELGQLEDLQIVC